MKAGLPAQETEERRSAPGDSPLSLRVTKARHDLHNSIGHIVGFSEMWLEEFQQQRGETREGLELIFRTAGEMMTLINERLNAPKIEAGLVNLTSLQREVSRQAGQIAATAENLARQSRAMADDLFQSDLSRIAAAARHVRELAVSLLAALSDSAQLQTPVVQKPASPPTGPIPITPEPPTSSQARKEGAILVVDDQEENRELLSRRLSPLGYSVQIADSGQRALELVAANPPDLILLDILMPGCDGFQVLGALKASPTTQHIPVIMLSALDEEAGIARCIEMGAEDYLAKPFNPVFLRARVSACMEKKRLGDREKATYEKLLRSQRKLAGELAEAATYVRSLLPAPLSGAVKAQWCFQPSAELGGDAFGYHWIDPDHLAIYLLDVCGHGVGAALLSVSVLNALRTQTLRVTNFREPASVLAALNRSFQSESQNNLFFSIWYGVYRLSQRQLSYASGGHPPAILLAGESGGTRSPIALRTEAPAVGCLEVAHYSTATHGVPPGARLLVFSDGAFEIFQSGDRAGTWKEFFQSFEQPEVQDLTPGERFMRALQIRGADSLEDDFSFVEFQFD